MEPKNAKYVVETEKDYEVSLLERGDLVRLKPGDKLLFDGVVVQGEVKAVDTICYGRDDPFEAKPGMRLKSGAEVSEGSCLFQIESALEDSMLFQISKQLALTQSENAYSETGITALFKNLSDHFVKGVILVALGVLVTWVVLLATD